MTDQSESSILESHVSMLTLNTYTKTIKYFNQRITDEYIFIVV